MAVPASFVEITCVFAVAVRIAPSERSERFGGDVAPRSGPMRQRGGDKAACPYVICFNW